MSPQPTNSTPLVDLHPLLHNAVYNVKSFGAVGNGTADDTSAIQATLDAATGAGSATSVARVGAEVVIPPGTYKITSPLVVTSVRGMKIRGGGPLNTKIVASATMGQALELNGFSLGEVSGLLVSGDSSHVVTRGIYYHWVPASAAGSSYGSVFRQVYVEGTTLLCDQGWSVGTDSTNDVSRSTWINCITAGGQASASTGGTWSDSKWQYGWKFGNDSVGNVLDNMLIDCTSDHWANGVGVTGANLTVHGGEIMHNKVDFWHTGGVAGPLVVSGIRSEWSERLYDSNVNGNPNEIVFNGIIWKTDHMPGDNFVIRWQGAGSMIIDGLQLMAGTRPSSSTPKISTGSSRQSMLHIRGVAVDNTAITAFIDNSGNPPQAQWTLEDFSTINGTTGVQSNHVGHAVASNMKAITYSATMATDLGQARMFTINATNGTAFTISNPTNPMAGQSLTYDIKNSSGGAMGAVTWGGAFLLAGAFTNPANGKRRTISFYYDGTNWVETNRAAADI